jgi:sulfate transport system permease protein
MQKNQIRASSFSGRWHWLLIGLVWLYVGGVIGVPLVSLLVGTLKRGLPAILATFRDPELVRSFSLTLQIALLVMVLHTVFGTAIAWVLVRHRFWGREILNGLLDLPFAVSPVVVGYMLLLLFGRTGWFAPLLRALGWQVAFAVPGMVLATLFVSLPFLVRELMPVLEAFGEQYEKAAATLGANGWQTFWLVTLPALRWGFLYGLTLTFARAVGEFGAVLVIGGGIKGRTETGTLFIYRLLDERQYAGAYTAALLLGLFSLALVLSSDWLQRRARADSA